MSDIVIIGAGGHGRVVLDIIRLAGQYEPVAFLDADPDRVGSVVGGLDVHNAPAMLPKLRRQNVKAAIVAIGDNRVRRSYAQLVVQNGLELINAIHPAATISPSATLGRNMVVAAGAVIGPEASIGDSGIINTSAVVDHECQVAEAVHICPGALLAGRVRVGPGSFIGLGAKIIQCLHVGAEATVGAGAVVLEDVPDRATVVGVPARVIKYAPDNDAG